MDLDFLKTSPFGSTPSALPSSVCHWVDCHHNFTSITPRCSDLMLGCCQRRVPVPANLTVTAFCFSHLPLQIINLSEKRHDLSKMNPKVSLGRVAVVLLQSGFGTWYDPVVSVTGLLSDSGYGLAGHARPTSGQDLHHLQSHGGLAQRRPASRGRHPLPGTSEWVAASQLRSLFFSFEVEGGAITPSGLTETNIWIPFKPEFIRNPSIYTKTSDVTRGRLCTAARSFEDKKRGELLPAL